MGKAFMIAATGSNTGKTTMTCGLLQAFVDRGQRVRSYKCGPDYIDPLFHERILGVTCKNLDLFFTDEKITRDLFWADGDRDLSIVEGVMGLYDGISPREDTASSYHLAKVLQIPVFLIVDAKGMGRSLLALIRGFLAMDTHHLIRGVILNRMTKSYYQMMAPVIEEELSLPVLGYLPTMEEISFESRYLGLTLPEEIEAIKEKVSLLGQTLSETIDLPRMLSLAGEVPRKEKSCRIAFREKRIPIAVARDEAFCFYYRDNLRMLEEEGAELIYFSPIHDRTLPENIGGLLLGGGYPELFAGELSDNITMKDSIQKAISRGLPSLAECGGFLYLHDAILGEDGRRYPMCGMIPGDCFYTGKLVRFGYVSVEEKNKAFLKEDTPYGPAIRGHEFHYYDSENNGSDAISIKPTGNRCWVSSFTGEEHWWGFAHLYYPSNPSFPRNFVNKCREFYLEERRIISTTHRSHSGGSAKEGEEKLGSTFQTH